MTWDGYKWSKSFQGNGMPVRKISKNYRSVTGTFASQKNGRNVFYESLLERDFFLTLEFDPTVSSYEEQPLELYYHYYNKRLKYTPDCLVHYNTEKLPCIYEVKFSDEIKEKKVFLEAKFEQIEKYLIDNDMNFKVFTEMDVDEIYLDNIKFLYNYVVIRNHGKINMVKQMFQHYVEITYQEFLDKYSEDRYEQAEIIPYIWHLVLVNFLSIDLREKITQHTLLKVV